jgi:uncharacterized protein
MKIAILINTPAQVHFFKNIAKKLNENGNKVIFLARDYGETLSVLDGIGIKYFIFSKSLKSKIGEILGFPFNAFRVYKYLSSINPDLVLGSVGIESFTSFFLKKPAIAFNDSEPHVNNFLSLEYKVFMPFINSIITPDTFLDDLGKKQIKVKSYKELAYLHPRYFTPDENIYDILKIDKNEEYIILRFNAFDAVHDIGMESFPLDKKRKLVKELEKYARVFISSEHEIHKDFEKYTLRIPKHKIHDCLYYAKMLVTDTQTMTTEAGILGTPVIRCNSFVGPKDMGNFIELENKYKLIFNYRNPDQAIEKAIALIQEPNIKSDWSKKKQKFFNEKVDITAFMVWYIENYPNSFKEMKNKPEIQDRFR